MIRILNLILLGTGLLGLIGVYAVKFHVEETAREKGRWERKISQQHADLSVLAADWSFVNQPGYIAPIIERHNGVLELAVVVPEQYKSIDELPWRPAAPAAPDDAALSALFEAIATGQDPIAALIEAN